jgi:hypothetical protein
MATLILGNISFEDGTAKIHEAFGVIECENNAQAKAIGEILCNEFTAYVIPELFSGEILLEESISNVGECVEKILADL